MKLSSTAVKKLFFDAWWALKLVWSTNAVLTFGFVASGLVHGIVPAGVAMVGRGLINTFVRNANSGAAAMEQMIPWLAVGFMLAIFEATIPSAQKFFTQRLSDDLNLRVTTGILEQAARLELGYFEDARRRQMIERAQQNPTEHLVKFIHEILTAMTAMLQTICLIAILIFIEPWIILALAPSALPYLFFHWRLSRQYYLDEYYRTPKRRWTNYFVSLLTSRNSITDVKLLGLAPFLISRFRSLMTQFRDEERALHRRSLAGSSVFAGITTIAFYVIFVRVVFKALRGALTAGDIAIFAGSTSAVRFTLERFILCTSSAMEQSLHISNLIEFLSLEPRIASGSFSLSNSTQGEIEFENVSFSYPGSSERVLTDVSLRIHAGETVAFVGENGAGKTTLVKLIARLYDPDEGAITFDGTDLREIDVDSFHRQIAFVLQDFVRYEATAMDNIAYGDWKTLVGNRKRVEEAAQFAGVHDMIESLPRGYDTMLGRLFGEFDVSGGQWQKIAIARAFSREASVLILDEPTSSLSIRAEYELFCRFRELSAGRTTILVSHRFSTLRMADRIFVMDRGQIVESGSHHELIAKHGRYARLYKLHREQTDAAN